MTGPGPGALPPLVRHASAVVLAGDSAGDHASRGDGHRTSAAFGVLIEGPSGSGKSALALQLIAFGARLVADDRTRIVARDGWPWLRAPERLAGVIEARGVGLIRVPCAAAAPLRLIVDMGEAETARLPEPVTRTVLGQRIRYIRRVDGPHFAGSIVALSKGGWWHDE